MTPIALRLILDYFEPQLESLGTQSRVFQEALDKLFKLLFN